MPQAAAKAGAYITQLSQKHDVDPFGVVALLSLTALSEVDFTKVAFWREVSDVMAGRA